MANDGWICSPNGWKTVENIFLFQKELINDNNNTNLILNDIEYIFVLAGGITDNGHVHPWVKRRLDLAIYIYKNNSNNKKNCKIICLGGGSYHIQPKINSLGFVIHESSACSEYLINNGINPKDIYKEWASYDTIANGYFAFTNYILPLNIKKFVLITSNFHMARSKEIFLWINSLFNNYSSIDFITVSDENIDDDIISKRIERENQSLTNLKSNVISKINTIENFVKWFFEDHAAYNSSSEMLRKNSISEDEKKSY
jgi:vancomycin permeability regulator SanA